MSDLQPGTIVWLKSGSPPMTVASIAEGGRVNCSWFDGAKKVNDHFRPEQLTDKNPTLTPLPPTR
jgi:uncharacterized protein YodC (DUF2158 family)